MLKNISFLRTWCVLCLTIGTACSIASQTTPNAPPAAGSLPSPTQVPPVATASLAPTSEPPPTLPAPTQTTTASPTSEPEDKIHPVILLSWDGGRADLVQDLMLDGYLPAVSSIAQRGVSLEYLLSVDPSLTAPAQTSLASGALPGRTGIVSNHFHNASDSFYWYREGFEEAIEQGEPLWVSASRAGLSTATVFFPGSTPDQPGQMADYTIGFGVRDAYSRQETIPLSPGSDWDGQAKSFSPVLEGSYQIPEVALVYFLVIDSSDDQQVNYDQVIVSTKQSVEAGTPALGEGEWGAVTLVPVEQAGADFLIQAITARELTFYHSAVYHNIAAPRDLLEELNAKFGFFPAGADAYALEHGWITAEDYLAQIEHAASWRAAVTGWVYQTYTPDLTFAWQNPFDAAGHAFLLTDPRQEGYSSQDKTRYAEYYRRAAISADQALQNILDGVDLDQATIVLASDHGMSPVHTTVYINKLLEDAGLLVLDKRHYVIVEETQALAFAAGGSAHIYINLSGREKQGVVPAENYEVLQGQIVELLRGLKDPVSAERVFQRVVPRQELADLGLDHPNAGDIFVQAAPGFNLDDWRGSKSTFATPRFDGQHGYSRLEEDMHALMYAVGYYIPGSLAGMQLPPASILDVSPTVASWLGLENFEVLDGEIIPQLGEN